MSFIECRLPTAFVSVVLILLLLLHGALAVESQESGNTLTRIIVGQATVVNNDLARTRDNAIRDSLRKAVVEALAFLDMEGPSVDKLTDLQIEKYIHQYAIISEKQAGVIYSVELRVAVDKGCLKNDFKARTGESLSKKITIDVKGIRRYSDYISVRDFLTAKTGGKVVPKELKTDRALFNFYTDEKIDTVMNKLSHMTSTYKMKGISNNVLEIDIESY